MIINHPDDSLESRGYFLANLLHFGHLLRKLDIPVSSQQIYDLAEGVVYINIASRDDFYNAARAFLLHNIDQLGQFNLAFDLFWSKHIKVLIDLSGGRKDLDQEFVAEFPDEMRTKSLEIVAMKSKFFPNDDLDTEPAPEIELRPAYSPNEVLYQKDFAEFSRDEFRSWSIGCDCLFSFSIQIFFRTFSTS